MLSKEYKDYKVKVNKTNQIKAGIKNLDPQRINIIAQNKKEKRK